MESNTTELRPKQKSGRRWLLALLALGGISLLALGCLGLSAYLVLSQLGPDLPLFAQTISKLGELPVRNRIALVGNDENIWLVGSDGQNLQQITPDGEGYSFPTWSPDSRYLAFIGPSSQNDTALYISPAASNAAPTMVYDQPDSAPFYLYWAPNSNTLTFLTQESDGLALRQVEATAPGSDRVLGAGAPFYWVWSPAADKVLMHVGGSRTSSPEAHLSLLDNQSGAERVQLDLAPGRFQAPYWSSDGQYFFYIAANEDQQEAIFKTNAASLEQTELIQLENFTYLTLSPDGQYLAYVEIDGNGSAPFGAAHLISSDGKNEKKLLDNPVGSVYWSPDSSKVALLTLAKRDDGSTAKAGGLAAPLPQEIFFRWLIYDIKTGTVETLASFVPTLAFLQTISYFDQYHLSLTFWSPDSRYFVYTNLEDENTHAGTIWVADTTTPEEPRQVGEGTLAIWSWK
jgi:Tol biopolymer transport system component